MTVTTISETPAKPSGKTKLSSDSERMEQRNYEEEKTKAKVKSEN